MKPEEKAKDLFVKNIELIPDYIKQIDAKHIAKYCAIIAVDEILADRMPFEHSSVEYWQDVRKEIEKI
jgi:hypothetical protein